MNNHVALFVEMFVINVKCVSCFTAYLQFPQDAKKLFNI